MQLPLTLPLPAAVLPRRRFDDSYTTRLSISSKTSLLFLGELRESVRHLSGARVVVLQGPICMLRILNM